MKTHHRGLVDYQMKDILEIFDQHFERINMLLEERNFLGCKRIATDLITNNFSVKSGGLPILQSNTRQRLWYLVQLRTSASDPNALEALPFIAHSAQIEAQQRFESVAGDGTS